VRTGTLLLCSHCLGGVVNCASRALATADEGDVRPRVRSFAGVGTVSVAHWLAPYRLERETEIRSGAEVFIGTGVGRSRHRGHFLASGWREVPRHGPARLRSSPAGSPREANWLRKPAGSGRPARHHRRPGRGSSPGHGYHREVSAGIHETGSVAEGIVQVVCAVECDGSRTPNPKRWHEPSVTHIPTHHS